MTRLDGPRLFSLANSVYAVGRFEPGWKGLLLQTGSILGTKRTSLFLVVEDRLARLSDLPSAGDTSYAGVAVKDDQVYVSYYTSRTDRDYPWIVGMLLASEVRMAKFSRSGLEALARVAR